MPRTRPAGTLLVAALLVGLLAAPVLAHRGTEAKAVAQPGAYSDHLDLVSSELDGRIRERAWDITENHIVTWTSATNRESKAQFLWFADDRTFGGSRETLVVGFTLEDNTGATATDWIDFGFDVDHRARVADVDAKVYRVYRTGAWAELSVEDKDITDSGDAADPPAGWKYGVYNVSSWWSVELLIPWDRPTLAGFFIAQEDSAASCGSTRCRYPSGAAADIWRPDTRWGDVRAIKQPVNLEFSVDKTLSSVDRTVNLSARIVPPPYTEDLDEPIRFDRSFDNVTWTPIQSIRPDSQGRAKLEYRILEQRDHWFRATTRDTGAFATGTSTVLKVTVRDLSVKVHGDGDTFVRYLARSDGYRDYTLVANASGTNTPTWEVSPNGTTWYRISTGLEGAAHTTTWTPPDSLRWHVRNVVYNADGAATARAVVQLSPYEIPPGTKTATQTVLTAESDSQGRLVLVATVTPSTATGAVHFWRTPEVALGTANLGSGVARLTLDSDWPGPQTYVARYAGSGTHAGSFARLDRETWPAVPGARTTDPTGLEVEVSAADGRVGAKVPLAFSAMQTNRPPLPGALEVRVQPPEGDAVVVFRGQVPSGAHRAEYTPQATGRHEVTAVYHSTTLDGRLQSDVRTDSFEATRLTVALSLELPPSFVAGEPATVTARFLHDGRATSVDQGTVRLERQEGTSWVAVEEKTPAGEAVTFAWTPTAAGTVPLRAVYTGAPAFTAATSDTMNVQVSEPAPPPPDDDGEPPEDPDREDGVPLPALVGLAALAIATIVRRRRQ